MHYLTPSVSGHPPAAMENISRIELPHRSTATVEPRVLDDPCDDLGDDPCDDLDDPNSAVPDLSCDCRGVDFERLRNFADIFDGASSVTDDDSGEFQVLQCTPDFYHRNSYDVGVGRIKSSPVTNNFPMLWMPLIKVEII